MASSSCTQPAAPGERSMSAGGGFLAKLEPAHSRAGPARRCCPTVTLAGLVLAHYASSLTMGQPGMLLIITP
jgi:hypothetical protein